MWIQALVKLTFSVFLDLCWIFNNHPLSKPQLSSHFLSLDSSINHHPLSLSKTLSTRAGSVTSRPLSSLTPWAFSLLFLRRDAAEEAGIGCLVVHAKVGPYPDRTFSEVQHLLGNGLTSPILFFSSKSCGTQASSITSIVFNGVVI